MKIEYIIILLMGLCVGIFLGGQITKSKAPVVTQELTPEQDIILRCYALTDSLNNLNAYAGMFKDYLTGRPEIYYNITGMNSLQLEKAAQLSLSDLAKDITITASLKLGGI